MDRGKRYAVCDKVHGIYRSGAYEGMFEFVDPRTEIPREEAGLFDCTRTRIRHPRETKGQEYTSTTEAGDCCSPRSPDSGTDSPKSGCC